VLRDDEARFDRLAEPDLVREDHAVQQGRAQGKERCVDLVGVHVDTRVRDRARDLFE